MKKNYLFIGAAAIMMAGCASDDLVGDETVTQNGDLAIGFSMNTPAMTRDGESNATDAGKLNYEFIVWGEKNETDKTETSAENLVFENYRVQYKDNSGNTKNTTASNTTGWDYVGIAPFTSGVTPKITTATQTIKYWDFGKTYTFTAVSAKPQDITDSKVKIMKIKGTTEVDTLSKGYIITLKKGADSSAIYVADRKEVTYKKAPVSAVQMQFRSFQTKIRFGFYETVPGYKVQLMGVKYNSRTDSVTTLGVDGNFVTVPYGNADGDSLTYEVKYDSQNVPVFTLKTSGSSTVGYKTFGSNPFNKDLGTTSTAAVYDDSSKGYSFILPNPSNSTAMSFTVSYKLISEDTGEEIKVYGKKVTVPAAYCQWKPNFAYTYLFKVSDSSTGLYPITFDACVVASQTGNQETITEVGEPSITTYAVKSDSKTVVTGQDEYQGKNIIYASVVDANSNVVTLSLNTSTTTNGNIKLYTAALADGVTGFKITEASVANAVAHSTNNKITVTDVTESSKAAITSDTDKVPAEDGTTRSISALKWTATKDTYYAIEYTYTDNNEEKKVYKVVKVGAEESNQ